MCCVFQRAGSGYYHNKLPDSDVGLGRDNSSRDVWDEVSCESGQADRISFWSGIEARKEGRTEAGKNSQIALMFAEFGLHLEEHCMEDKKIEILYQLLERAEGEKDPETAAALRWAIFQLEAMAN